MTTESPGSLAEQMLANALPNAKVTNSVSIPLLAGKVFGTVVSFENLIDGAEHLAICLGKWDESASVQVRLHSECLTGDVFGSAKCDCGPQLNEALNKFSTEGGVLLYLRQEGRGIGLYNKLAAYALQQKGQDTFEANKSLNFPSDSRNYAVAAQMLFALNCRKISLLTNNPDKANQLKKYGIQIENILKTGLFLNEHNAHYLRAKALQTKHDLKLEDIESFAKSFQRK